MKELNNRLFAAKRGFTLIELLIVVALIGCLSVIMVLALNSANKRSRDAIRIADLTRLQNGLDLYFIRRNAFPEGNNVVLGSEEYSCLNENGWQSAGCADPLLDPVPVDPKNGSYVYTSVSSSFILTTKLEGTFDNLSGVIHLTPSGGISK
jgi:prepilin-type N-terminal cleavage/methylation domain-containing protein